jgi:hypothetical protein
MWAVLGLRGGAHRHVLRGWPTPVAAQEHEDRGFDRPALVDLHLRQI